jgi:hypothetical protein
MRPGKASASRTVERIESARDADERVLEHLVRLGCDLSSPREIHHFLYLPTRGDADTVADELEGDGWLTSVEESEGAWLVVAKRARALTSELVFETRVRLAALASACGGVYDGWEVPLTQ